jgi:hypothetical protein
LALANNPKPNQNKIAKNILNYACIFPRNAVLTHSEKKCNSITYSDKMKRKKTSQKNAIQKIKNSISKTSSYFKNVQHTIVLKKSSIKK